MGSPETIPLNLEPESGIYYDPVVVLDFQSLYPSVCIAYNYCFTTCLGKLSRLKALVKDVEQGQGLICFTKIDEALLIWWNIFWKRKGEN